MRAPIDGMSVVASHLGWRGGQGRVLLDDLSFAVRPGELLAILGNSGAGKSTLLKLLAGQLKPSSGQLLLNGRALPSRRHLWSRAIGYVPQDDTVHAGLPVERALLYAARLRLPAGTPPDELRARVRETLDLVGLTERAGAPIGRLSGGERKRACIAVEILTRPSLLLLDEPTASLDPPWDRQIMALLRRFADEGQTVVVVTHKTTSVDLCDRVLFLAAGGRLAFHGAPDQAREYFLQPELDRIYDLFETEQAACAWQARFARQAETSAEQPRVGPAETAPASSGAEAGPGPLGQVAVLAHRYLEILRRDTRNLAYLLAQPLAVAVMLRLVADAQALVDPARSIESNKLAFLLVCAAAWFGIINSVREIVKEATIFQREYQVGVGPVAYVLSKLGVLGVLSGVQVGALLATLALLGLELPSGGIALAGGPELFVTLLGTALTGVALGLALSALTSSRDRAMSLVPLLLIPQIVFADMIFKLEGAVDRLAWVVATRSGLQALVATARLPFDAHGQPLGPSEASAGYLAARWLLLLALALAGIALTTLALRIRAGERSPLAYGATLAPLTLGLLVAWSGPLALPGEGPAGAGAASPPAETRSQTVEALPTLEPTLVAEQPSAPAPLAAEPSEPAALAEAPRERVADAPIESLAAVPPTPTSLPEPTAAPSTPTVSARETVADEPEPTPEPDPTAALTPRTASIAGAPPAAAPEPPTGPVQPERQAARRAGPAVRMPFRDESVRGAFERFCSAERFNFCR